MTQNKAPADIFRQYLKRGKNRITPERFEILDATLQYEGHFTADELFLFLKNNNSRVSRATVYNTLELLKECDLVAAHNFGGTMKKYESTTKRHSHDHLICLDCGRIIEFNNTKVKKISEDICENLGFDPSTYSFNIFVRCKNKANCPYYNE